MFASGKNLKNNGKERIGRNFRLVTINTGLSTVGTSAFSLAIIWITLSVTGSPVISGFADGMGALPLFLSFAFGAYIDSMVSKRNIAIISSVLRAIVILGLLVAIMSSSLFLEIVSIYSVAFVVGLTSDILNSARASWTKQFLTDEQYQRGSALMQSVTSLAQAQGFVGAGMLILLGLEFAVYSFAIILAISALPLFFLKNESAKFISSEKSISSSIASGLKFIFSSNSLRAIKLLSLVSNLAFGTLGILMAFEVDEKFSLPAIYFTAFFLSLTLGIFAGSALGSKAKGKVGPYTVVMLLLVGAALALIGFLQNMLLAYPISFSIGFILGVTNVLIMTAMVKIVNQEMMGRTMGAINTFAISMTFLSGAIGGVLIRFLTVSGAFYFIGAVLALTAIGPLIFREFYNLQI